jgi:TRAP-type transport system small permease protein
VRALQRWSVRLNRAAYYVACTILFLLLTMTVFNVLGRYLFTRPVRGTVELTGLAMAAIVFLGLGYAQHRGDHIAVDLVYERLPLWLQHVARWLVGLVTLALLGFMSWRGLQYAASVRDRGAITSVLGLPTYPAVYLALAGLLLFALALLSTLFTAHLDDVDDDLDEVEQ